MILKLALFVYCYLPPFLPAPPTKNNNSVQTSRSVYILKIHFPPFFKILSLLNWRRKKNCKNPDNTPEWCDIIVFNRFSERRADDQSKQCKKISPEESIRLLLEAHLSETSLWKIKSFLLRKNLGKSNFNGQNNSENVSTLKVGVLNVEFALRLRIYRFLKSVICLKWIRKKLYTTLHTQFNYLT